MNTRSKGSWLAASAAALFCAGGLACSSDGTDGATTARVQCNGANDCKGRSECQTAESGCAGLNSCKGKGWLMVTREMCERKGGTVVEG